MSLSKQSVQSYYMEFLRCAGCSEVFAYENPLHRPITLPVCGHTMCGGCIYIMRDEKKCPQDEVSFEINDTSINQLPTNYPLLIIHNEERYGDCPSYMKLDDLTRSYFTVTEDFLGEISLFIKPIINDEKRQSIFSRSTTRKIFSLLNNQYINHEGRSKVLEAIRSLGEHICIDCIRHYQKPQQLKDNLEAAIRLPKGHFPEPEKVLKTILLFLKCCHPITSGENLVESMAQIVQRKDPYGILSRVHDIVHLLSITPCCFQMVEQADSSSSIKLKPEFQNYESIRREYDSRIIEMAMSNDFCLSAEQWSYLFYGNMQHEFEMALIYQKLHTPQSFTTAINLFYDMAKHAQGDPQTIEHLRGYFQFLSNIDLEKDASQWYQYTAALGLLKKVLKLLINLHK
ncbi:unnamed protein product [Rotaria sp. Silwood2]|nr:unnamed protein product [Rotaria sp. Silwood2]CAF2972984.1 unnamed protein product [Rotaria sp. Silwood2]CAF3394137.1 unnamed protein product [Rotaria sp. Silwood2]CAF4317702.1 unnamed protein product [Rotaria sp. Silwood2]CAF4325007.1 unnamed protein product [Rotaria sp. Silwood2]